MSLTPPLNKMMRFNYKAYSATGSHKSGLVEAASDIDAMKRLRESGLQPYALEQSIERFRFGLGVDQKKKLILKNADLSKFFSGLSVLLNARFSLDDALRLTQQIETEKKLKRIYEETRRQTAQGETLANVLESIVNVPPHTVAVIASGEAVGALDQAVSRVAESFEKRETLRREILQAVTYPVFLICLLIVVLVLLSTQLVPALAPIFSASGTETPVLIGALLTIGDFISRFQLAIIVVLAIVSLALFNSSTRHRMRSLVFAPLRRLPVVGRHLQRLVSARYLQTLALLIESRLPLKDALVLSANAVEGFGDQSKLQDVARSMTEGGSLNSALRDTGLFDDYVLSFISVGEESDNLEEMTKRAADMVQSQVTSVLQSLLAALSPVLTIVIGLVVGGLVVSVMTALLSLNEAVIQ